jgi:hypothetical protein
MADLVQNPRPVLGDVVGAFRIALRRLCRARNIILHGGATQGVALEASLRTAAPLVGPGLDRIVHAAYAEDLDPSTSRPVLKSPSNSSTAKPDSPSSTSWNPPDRKRGPPALGSRMDFACS